MKERTENYEEPSLIDLAEEFKVSRTQITKSIYELSERIALKPGELRVISLFCLLLSLSDWQFNQIAESG